MDDSAEIGPIASHNSGVIGSINVVVHQAARRPSEYPDGSIGNNPAMGLYLTHLVDRFFFYRMQEVTSDPGTKEYAEAKKEIYGRLNGAVKSRFGGYRMRLPTQKFHLVADYLKACVDNTSEGKQAAAQGKPRYKTFEEHQALGN